MTATVLVTNPNADLYGASRMMVETVAAFRAAGWRVVVTSPELGASTVAAETHGAEVVACPNPVLRKTFLAPAGLVRLVWTALRATGPSLRLLRELRPDVVYVNTVVQPLWPALGRLRRIPVVVHVHEAEASMPRPARLLLAAPLLLATRIIANSHYTRAVLGDTIARLTRRCEVVHNGVGAPSAAVPLRSCPGSPVRLLYVGRLSDRKGPADCIDAVALLRQQGVDVRLDIAGDVYPGYEHVEADLRAGVGRAGLDDRVHFHGFVRDVAALLGDADVLVVPSRGEESFGRTAIEGLLARRPVIVTDVGALPEVVEGARAVEVVPPADPAALAQAVRSLLARWDDLRQQTTQDASVVAGRFSPATYRQQVAGCVATIMGVG